MSNYTGKHRYMYIEKLSEKKEKTERKHIRITEVKQTLSHRKKREKERAVIHNR